MHHYRKPRAFRPAKGRKTKAGAIFLGLVVLLAGLAGYLLGSMNEKVIIYYNETITEGTVNYVPYNPVNVSYSNASYASVIIPAVDEEGNGLTTVLTVQIIPGEGRVLANIDKMLFWTDTQNSIRTSSRVASNITGINLSQYDIIYTIATNATSVEGPSAGTALTIATIAAIQKRGIDTKVMITGAINPDGTIGPVGQILTKAKVAKDVGARLLLVPVMQSQAIAYETRRYCEQMGPSQICTTEKVPKTVNVSEEAGIEVREVGDVREALEYFLIGGQP